MNNLINQQPTISNDLSTIIKNKYGNNDKLMKLILSNIASVNKSGGELQRFMPVILEASAIGISLSKTSGEGYIVEYKGYPQFQLGYKGIIQLIMKTGQVQSFNAWTVCEGDKINYNDFNEPIFVRGENRNENKVIGYIASILLFNGYRKTNYMTKEQATNHALKYSMSYQKTKKWGLNNDFDAMALKTTIRLMSKWLPKSNEFEIVTKALQLDQAIVLEDGTYDYIDNPNANHFKSTPSEEKEIIELVS